MGTIHRKGSIGNSRNYTVDEFRKAVDAYIKFLEKNPIQIETLQKVRVAKDCDEIVRVSRNQRRPGTMTGLALFMGMTQTGLYNYNKGEYQQVFEYAQDYLSNQLLEGGLSGQFEPNLTARKLGLAERTEARMETIQTIETVEIAFTKREDKSKE